MTSQEHGGHDAPGIGFEVVDLGINLTAEEFVKQVKEQSPDILDCPPFSPRPCRR